MNQIITKVPGIGLFLLSTDGHRYKLALENPENVVVCSEAIIGNGMTIEKKFSFSLDCTIDGITIVEEPGNIETLYKEYLNYIENTLKIKLFDYQKRILKGLIENKKILAASGARYSYVIEVFLKAKQKIMGYPWNIKEYYDEAKTSLENYRPSIEEADIIIPYTEIVEETNTAYPEGFLKKIRKGNPERFERDFNFWGKRK